MTAQHTAGPWRWEINRGSKSLHLVGGKPQFDLTVMDFERWGMSGATIRLRDVAHDGMNIMHKLHERPDWIAPLPGRAHHADWFAAVIHPDARLMEAAPDLLDALRSLRNAFLGTSIEVQADALRAARAAIAKATGGAA